MDRSGTGEERTAVDRASAVAPVALVTTIAAALGAQLGASTRYDSVRDPLSSLEWTAQGWLFPVALSILAIGMFCAATVLHAVRTRLGRLPAVLSAAAGVGAALTAVFPADEPDALMVSTIGEVHRWGSLAILVLPMMAALVVFRVLRTEPTMSESDRAGRRRLVALIVATGVSGLVFLGGFLPALIHTDASIFRTLAGVNGLSQRFLAVLVVVTIWQLVDIANSGRPALLRPRQAGDTDPGAVPTARRQGHQVDA